MADKIIEQFTSGEPMMLIGGAVLLGVAGIVALCSSKEASSDATSAGLDLPAAPSKKKKSKSKKKAPSKPINIDEFISNDPDTDSDEEARKAAKKSKKANKKKKKAAKAKDSTQRLSDVSSDDATEVEGWHTVSYNRRSRKEDEGTTDEDNVSAE